MSGYHESPVLSRTQSERTSSLSPNIARRFGAQANVPARLTYRGLEPDLKTPPAWIKSTDAFQVAQSLASSSPPSAQQNVQLDLERAKPVSSVRAGWVARCSRSFQSVLRRRLLRCCGRASHTDHCLCPRMPSESKSPDRGQAPGANQSASPDNARFREVSGQIRFVLDLVL